MSTEFNNHSLIDLEKLFLNDSVEILRLQQEFETNGWCFVQLPHNNDSFISQLNHINESLSNFFTLEEKNKYLTLFSSNGLGYSCVDHKEGIRLITSQNNIIDFGHFLSANLQTSHIQTTLQVVSKLISDLTYRLKPIITKLTVSNQRASKQVKLSPYAMLDIVHYFNTKTGPTEPPEVGYNTDEVNCVPHFDPGLFSLSILLTCDGLQLKDQRENKWIDGPNNSQLDQIIYPRTAHKTRLTIWQEVCTEAQIKQLFEQYNDDQHLLSGAQVMLANQSDSIPMTVLSGGETSLHFMQRIEQQRGLPRTKLAPSYLHIYPQVDRKRTTKNSSSTQNNISQRYKKKKQNDK